MSNCYQARYVEQTLNGGRQLAALIFLLILTFMISAVKADQGTTQEQEVSKALVGNKINSILTLAALHLDNNHYDKAKELYEQLLTNQSMKTQAMFGLAKVYLYQDELDTAEDFIEKVLERSSEKPEYWFIAGRIAGKQAQSASIFTKLSYAKDTKKFFSKAQQLNKNHQASLIGLIRFHQQAPVMAGGDKAQISILLDRLRRLDKRAAFNIEAPLLLEEKRLDKLFSDYSEALKGSDRSDSIGNRSNNWQTEQFQFDFAMLLSAYGHYQPALKEFLSIKLPADEELPEFAIMRMYQIAKNAAESNSNLALGIKNIKQYSELADTQITIPRDWVDFRLAQLQFLKERSDNHRTHLIKLRKETSDKELKRKIKSFIGI